MFHGLGLAFQKKGFRIDGLGFRVRISKKRFRIDGLGYRVDF